MRDHKLYLRDILDAMDRIEDFVEGMDFEEFQPKFDTLLR